jgi:4-diphosphocytidyl-2-C-methyl-D-erythritol kinase
MAPVVELAGAKVNLSLQVLRRRDDGYHDITSVVAFAGVGDEVKLERGALLSLDVRGPFAGAISGANLVLEALAALQRAAPRLVLGAVELTKTLPVAAGLGGGSADAAALLRAVRRANPDLAAVVPWHDIAVTLGADVPACLLSRAAVLMGKGDVLQPLGGMPPLPAVLVHPGFAGMESKTAQVFERFATLKRKPSSPRQIPVNWSSIEEVATFVGASGNDLLAPAMSLWPELGDVLRTVRASRGCLVAAMSGAGPSCFGLFADERSATEAAAIMAAAQPAWWVRAARLS